MKLFLVRLVDDPYVADGVLGVFTSEEQAKSAFPTELWKWISSRPHPEYPQYADDDSFRLQLWRELHSGRELEVRGHLDRPDVNVTEIESDTNFSSS